LAFDLKIGPANGHIAHQAVNPGEPSNEIVPALMTFWLWVSRLSITTALCEAFQFVLYTEAMIAARPTAPLLAWNLSQLKAGMALACGCGSDDGQNHNEIQFR
jgi:hypothetical protein